MADLLTPEEVQKILKDVQKEFAGELIVILDRDAFEGLCRDYLTLWEELKAERELSDQLVKQVRELEQRNEWLNECLNEEQADRNAR